MIVQYRQPHPSAARVFKQLCFSGTRAQLSERASALRAFTRRASSMHTCCVVPSTDCPLSLPCS